MPRDTLSCHVKSQDSLKNQLFCTSLLVLSMTAFHYRGWKLGLLQGAHHSPAPIPQLHIHLSQVNGNGSSRLRPWSESWQSCSGECMNQMCDSSGNHKCIGENNPGPCPPWAALFPVSAGLLSCHSVLLPGIMQMFLLLSSPCSPRCPATFIVSNVTRDYCAASKEQSLSFHGISS